MAADIDILAPLSGSTKPWTFKATGTYELAAAGDPPPVVRLENASGAAVGTVTMTAPTPTPTTWEASFTFNSNHTNLTLIAELPGTDEAAEESNISIQENVGVELNPVPIGGLPFPGPTILPGGPAGAILGAAPPVPEGYTFTGTRQAKVAAVLVTAIAYTAKGRLKRILRSQRAEFGAGNSWSCEMNLTFSPPLRLVVKVYAYSRLGVLIGQTAGRNKRA